MRFNGLCVCVPVHVHAYTCVFDVQRTYYEPFLLDLLTRSRDWQAQLLCGGCDYELKPSCLHSKRLAHKPSPQLLGHINIISCSRVSSPHVCLCTMCRPAFCGSRGLWKQRRVLYAFELKPHVGAQSQTRALWKKSGCSQPLSRLSSLFTFNFYFLETESHGTQTCLELLIFLPLLPSAGNHRSEPPHPAQVPDLHFQMSQTYLGSLLT